jgi:hypothetical protein
LTVPIEAVTTARQACGYAQRRTTELSPIQFQLGRGPGGRFRVADHSTRRKLGITNPRPAPQCRKFMGRWRRLQPGCACNLRYRRATLVDESNDRDDCSHCRDPAWFKLWFRRHSLAVGSVGIHSLARRARMVSTGGQGELLAYDRFPSESQYHLSGDSQQCYPNRFQIEPCRFSRGASRPLRPEDHWSNPPGSKRT